MSITSDVKYCIPTKIHKSHLSLATGAELVRGAKCMNGRETQEVNLKRLEKKKKEKRNKQLFWFHSKRITLECHSLDVSVSVRYDTFIILFLISFYLLHFPFFCSLSSFACFFLHALFLSLLPFHLDSALVPCYHIHPTLRFRSFTVLFLKWISLHLAFTAPFSSFHYFHPFPSSLHHASISSAVETHTWAIANNKSSLIWSIPITINCILIWKLLYIKSK